MTQCSADTLTHQPAMSITTGDALYSLDNRGDAHAAADAQGDQACGQVAPLQLVQHSAEQHSAGGTNRVAEGNRATVNVDLVRVNFQVAHGLERHHGEGFVDLPQVN